MKLPLFLLVAAPVALLAQPASLAPAPAPQPAPAAAPAASGGAPAGDGSFLGKDVPFFDPSSETFTWNGKNWNINNNRIFEAKFAKYLNDAPYTSQSNMEYEQILEKIMDDLAPARATEQSSDEAFQLLSKAAQYPEDARLCDAIATQVYSAWLAKNNNQRIAAANKVLEEERKRLEWNSKVTADAAGSDLSKPSAKDSVAMAEWQKQQQTKRDVELQPMLQRIQEINALTKANQLKREVAQLQVKIEFQSLIVQHFLQRRFQHVLIGTRFYRQIFSDGDGQLRVGEDTKNLFTQSSGLPPTLGTIDSLADEAIHEVQDGVQAFKFLLSQKELDSATKRLSESFVIGEYLPEIRMLDRDDKRQALAFVQKTNQLISAIEVKDYTLAEKLVKDLEASAKDFDASKPTAAIETARQISAMHIAKAKNAAVSGDKETLETELKAATELWPRNPALAEVSSMIFSQADVQSRALVDFDQLLSQKNYRQIFDDKMKFIPATAMYPQKQEQLRQVLDQMQVVETSIIQAQEIAKQGNYPAAWETAEKAFRQFPDDNKLNQLRADLTTQAAGFVHDLRQAQELEQKDQYGSSLAWYLKAQSTYPPSEFARDGVQRVIKAIMPDAT